MINFYFNNMQKKISSLKNLFKVMPKLPVFFLKVDVLVSPRNQDLISATLVELRARSLTKYLKAERKSLIPLNHGLNIKEKIKYYTEFSDFYYNLLLYENILMINTM